MKEENDAIYGKPRFGLIVGGFCLTILLCIVAALVFFRSGHPDMHTQPQPKNNKGMLIEPVTQPSGRTLVIG